MEVFAILFGIIFWPAAIIVWLLYVRKKKPRKLRHYVGTLLVIGMPVLAAISMCQYMFLDEPLVFAVRDGDIVKVKSLLAYGASPDASFEGNPALEQAAAQGQQETVRLLLAHGARLDTRNTWSDNTALISAQKNGHTEVIKILKQAGATR